MYNSFCKKTIIILLFTTLLHNISYGKNIDAPIAITFEGNRYIDTETLENIVGAKRGSPLEIWEDRVATINALYIPKLDEIFRLFYQKEGFYKAEISHKIDIRGIVNMSLKQ